MKNDIKIYPIGCCSKDGAMCLCVCVCVHPAVQCVRVCVFVYPMYQFMQHITCFKVH